MNTLLTEKQAAEYLGLSRRTLQGWRFNGHGPAFCRINRKVVRYQQHVLDEWLNGTLTNSTTAPTKAEKQKAAK